MPVRRDGDVRPVAAYWEAQERELGSRPGWGRESHLAVGAPAQPQLTGYAQAHIPPPPPQQAAQPAYAEPTYWAEPARYVEYAEPTSYAEPVQYETAANESVYGYAQPGATWSDDYGGYYETSPNGHPVPYDPAPNGAPGYAHEYAVEPAQSYAHQPQPHDYGDQGDVYAQLERERVARLNAEDSAERLAAAVAEEHKLRLQAEREAEQALRELEMMRVHNYLTVEQETSAGRARRTLERLLRNLNA